MCYHPRVLDRSPRGLWLYQPNHRTASFQSRVSELNNESDLLHTTRETAGADGGLTSEVVVYVTSR